MQALQRRQRGIPESASASWFGSLSWPSRLSILRSLKQAWRTSCVRLRYGPSHDISPTDQTAHTASEKVELDEWTDVHSWCALMGGFAFDTSTADRPFLPSKHDRPILTHEGLILLAERWPSLLPTLSSTDILDKSKSDGLTKLLSCWQATWFCIQCVFRVAEGLSVGLLELNVFGHAVCILLVYTIWWSKPKDILEPFKLARRGSDEVAALLSSLSPIGAVPVDFGTQYRRPSPGYFVRCNACDEFAEFFPALDNAMQFAVGDLTAPGALRIGDSYWRLRFPTRRMFAAYSITVGAELASRLVLMQGFDASDPIWSQDTSVALVSSRSSDWSLSDELMTPDLRKKHTYGVIVACGLYGGMHSLAWHVAFPTAFEQLLWRTAGLTVALTGPIWFFSLLITGLADPEVYSDFDSRFKEGYPLMDEVLEQFIGRPDKGAHLWVVLACILWYAFCRVFLVVECFINVAHLSEGALRVPVWSTYVPHLS